MTGRRRRELAESFRLVARDEQWFFRDLIVGVLAFVVWTAGTGALVAQVGRALALPVGPGTAGPPSPLAIATFAVLWLFVPAIAVVVRLRSRMLNLRGNVEQYYRLDHPAALLAPPALAVALVVAIAAAIGAFPWYFALVMVPVGLAALVRTLAFSYRVYSFSHPLFVQAVAALSTVVLVGSVLAALAAATGRSSLVAQVLMTAGFPAWITGSVSAEGVSISGTAAASVLPVVLASAYVFVQTAVALGVRVARPEVDRSRTRTGQRYPPFLASATPMETAVRPTGTEDDSGGRDDAATADSGTGTTGDSGAGVGDGGAIDRPADDEDLNDVSNTRVFTPPADDDAGPDFGPGSTTDGGLASNDDSDTRAVPAADDDSSTAERRERCGTCGESFTVDSPVRFCPSCGAALDGE